MVGSGATWEDGRKARKQLTCFKQKMTVCPAAKSVVDLVIDGVFQDRVLNWSAWGVLSGFSSCE
jgi:hypothetical protein